MVNEAALDLTFFVEAVHFNALGIAFGVAAACHDNAGTAALMPLYVHLVELVVVYSLEYLVKVGVQHGENHLCLGIAEAA